MRSDVTQGQSSGYRGVDLVMDDNFPAPAVLLTDRNYDSDKIEKMMEARTIVFMIPMCQPRRLRVAVDRSLYRLRSLVERCFNKLKNAHRVAIRYNKTSESYIGFLDIAWIRLWLRRFSV